MSVNYASGLSPFPDKGECGQPEKFDAADVVEEKCQLLASWIKEAQGAVVVHTGAGISTSCGIPDFRGPKGVWTLEKRGEAPVGAISFVQARPSLTHMAMVALEELGLVRAVITQNVDGLHLRSGFPRNRLAILHGDMFTEECELCHCHFARPTSVPTMGLKRTGGKCGRTRSNALGQCRGRLRDTILDWEDALPDTDLDFAREQSKNAQLSLCLGSSLQIVPGGELPLLTKPRRKARRRRTKGLEEASQNDGPPNDNNATATSPTGRIAIVNLQATKRDKDADLKIHAYVDQVIQRVCDILEVKIPAWTQPKLVLLSKHTKAKEKYQWNLVIPTPEPTCKMVKIEEESKLPPPLPCEAKKEEKPEEEVETSEKPEIEFKVKNEAVKDESS